MKKININDVPFKKSKPFENHWKEQRDLIKYNTQETFFMSPHYEEVYKNFDKSKTYDVWIYKGDISEKDVGYKKIKSYPYSTVQFQRGDYIHWKYNKKDTVWLLETLDEHLLYDITGRIYLCLQDLKWKNKYGKEISYPCVIQDRLNTSTFDINKNIILQDGTVYVDVQQNDDTMSLEANDRVMFDGQSFKITFKESFIGGNYITFTLVKDDLAPDDNKETNIANSGTYNYTLKINQGSFKSGFNVTNVLSVSVFNNNVLLSPTPEIEWYSSDESVVSVNKSTGEYKTYNKEGTASITCKMKENDLVSDSVDINVKKTVEDEYQIIIEPQVTKILQGNSQQYTVYLYKNNIKQSDAIDFEVSGIVNDNKYYEFVKDNANQFTIINKKRYSTNKLTISCTVNSINSKININLSGSF